MKEDVSNNPGAVLPKLPVEPVPPILYVSDLMKTFVVNLKKVRVGGIEVDNVKGGVIEGQHPTEVLLGNSFLNEVSLSQKSSIMMLTNK